MNELEQLREQLITRFPGRSIIVGCQAVFTVAVKNETYLEYVIVITPGFESRFLHLNLVGNTLQECLDKLNQTATGQIQL